MVFRICAFEGTNIERAARASRGPQRCIIDGVGGYLIGTKRNFSPFSGAENLLPSRRSSSNIQTFQRNQVFAGLIFADNDDLVICADLYEIPKHTVVKELKAYYKDPTINYNRNEVFYLQLDWYAFKLNAIVEEQWRNGTYVTTCKTLRSCTPENVQNGTVDSGSTHTSTLVHLNKTFSQYVLDNRPYFIDKGYIELAE